MSSEQIFFNGINASNGTYAHQPLTADQLATLIRGDDPKPESIDPDTDQLAALKDRNDQVKTTGVAVKEGTDPSDISKAGWGVIFPAGPQTAAIREALGELLDWRSRQAGQFYRECDYLPNESKAHFLSRQGAATSGAADPDKLPYYLLIVGSPEEIPYRFQYQLDVQYAVGRIHFDNLDDYARYAHSVVSAERGEVKLPRKAVFFGVQNDDDIATALAANGLVRPLASKIAGHKYAVDWDVQTVIGAEARKDRLSQFLGGSETPAILFTASHGVEFDNGDPRQIAHQGAILCQDWQGPRWSYGRIPESLYFSGDDIGDGARLLGTIAFCFACFGAGTPRDDDFPHQKGFQAAIAPHAFMARLPQRLLAHPKGGALAVIGHVERAWTFSFNDANGRPQIGTFESAMRSLMFAGVSVGMALEFFNNRYAELATGLTEDMENIRTGTSINPLDLSTKWTEHNDARSYVVIGDPAVRLPLADRGTAPTSNERATIPTITAATVSVRPPDLSVKTPAPAPPPVAPPSVPSAGTQGWVVQAQVGDNSASFGIFGSGEKGSEAMNKLTTSLQEFAERLGETLKRAIEDASHLEVETYVADDLSTVNYREGDFSGAQLRAVTRMALDGDTQVVVPRRGDLLDTDLWAIHTSMVQQAQSNRAEMIRTLAAAAAGLFSSLK